MDANENQYTLLGLLRGELKAMDPETPPPGRLHQLLEETEMILGTFSGGGRGEQEIRALADTLRGIRHARRMAATGAYREAQLIGRSSLTCLLMKRLLPG